MGGSLEGDSDEEVLYHQLGQDDVEESIERQGRKRILRRATMDKNLDLSIHNRRLFLVCLAVVEVPGVLATITTIHWAIDYKGGLTYVPNRGIPFNWHPILMTLSLIFLYGNGALIYRIIPPRSEAHKMRLKMAVGAACMGHLEKMIWSNMKGYAGKESEMWLVN